MRTAEIEQESGNPSWDRAALTAAQAVRSVPPPPSRWQETYTEAEINSTSDHGEGGYPPVCHLLAITDLADRFASLLKV